MGIVAVAPSCVPKVGGLPSDAGRVLVEAQHQQQRQQQQQQQQQRLWRVASCRVCDPKAVGRSRRGRSYGSYGALPNSSPISSVNISSAQIVAQRAISVSVSLHVFLHSCVPSSSSSRNCIAFRSWNRQISPALRLASVWTRSVSTGAKTWLSRRNGIARSRSGKRKQGATALNRLRNNASPTAAAAHSALSNKNSKFCCDVFSLPTARTLKVKKKQLRQGVCCRSSSKVVSSEALITPGWTPSLSYEQAIRLQAQEEESLLFRNGPPPGDIAEVEAFCRIHRLAELLHAVVMGCLRSSHNLTTKQQQQQQMSVENDRDVPVLEEKVVAGLARMGAVLQQGRLEVLGGGRHVVNNVGDAIPSLARMRVELMDCCEALQKALELCFAPVPESIHRPMQQLHTVCLDAGFPRLPGSPSHADIPNFAAVKLRPFRGGYNLDQEEEVAFWRGGQMTVEGLEWLLQQGFKVVVDMRVEQTGSLLTQRALQAAEDSGLLRIVKIPVSVGMVPTMEQVKEFAMLVADADNKPLYLHSQRGVGRACAMVSRWREFVLHQSIENILNGNEISTADDVVGISRESGDEVGGSAVYSAEVMQELTYTGNELMLASTSSSSQQLSSSLEEETADALEAGFEDNRFKTSVEATSTMREGRKSGREAAAEDKYNYEEAISWTKNAFEAQRPGPKVFCRKSMSEFTKRRKSMPGAAGLQRGVMSLSSAIKQKEEIDIAGPAGRWGLATPGIPRAESFETPALSNGSLKEKETQEQKAREDAGEQARVNGQKGGHASTNGTYSASVPASSRSEQEAQQTEEEEEEDDDDDDGEENAENGGLCRVEPIVENGDGNGGELKGDMCASTTGVVRVQSRRKAEMYLVRTDGFSCTRERVKESTLAFTHPSTQQQMLMWKTSPKTVLLLKKLGSELMEEAQQVASFLFHQEGMNVMVEPDVHDMFARLPGYGFVQTFYNHDTSELHERVDFVVCLGGDGVILHASNLFRNAIPPVVSFNLGSLGFLTAHPFEEFKQDLRAIINGNSRMGGVYITLRMRLRCELFRNGKPIPGKVYDVLNEVVVDRGSNPYLCKIECYERSRLITKVQADGVLVATPTGSTAYSTAAGGSMVHPNVPCMLFTPICPHSLSFRPVILPDSALLELKVPDDARSNAWVSFDGKKRQQLCKGESVRICMSEHPMPTVNKHDQTDDWFGSLSRCFGWNQRIEQRSISFLM